MTFGKGKGILKFVKAEKKVLREEEEVLFEFGPLTREDTRKAKQRRKRQIRKAKRAERAKEEEQMSELESIISGTRAISD